MYAKWTTKETQSLNLIINSQQCNDLYLSQQQQQQVLEPYTQTSSSGSTQWYTMLKSSFKKHKIKMLAKI